MITLILGRSSGEANICIWEGRTWDTNTGTRHPVYNRNRNSANTTTLLEDSNGTFTAGNVNLNPDNPTSGTCIYDEHFGSGQSRGGATTGRNEFILKQNTTYAITITSEAASNDVELILDWYEHTNKN